MQVSRLYKCFIEIIFSITCIFYTNNCQSQTKTINVTVWDSSGGIIKPFSIKLQRILNQSIITHQYIADTNFVKIPIGQSFPDSFRVIIESSAYMPFAENFSKNDPHLSELEVILRKANSTLKNVLITAPPVWKRGDTTFYRVEAFKSGEEKKLKDIIEKLPDFKIDKSGVLLYKNKVVEKILIDGEELFSDKTDLLLSSFPVHVLDQIQALENQNDQKLLKGLKDDNRVFVNLKLNDKRLQTTFGDLTISGGLPNRYKIAPTLFGLRNRVKFGVISNINNLGEGFGFKSEQELKTEPQPKMESWLINNLSLQYIPEFESKYYVRNQLFDNRLQVNMPIGKKSVFKQEVSYVRDERKQNTYNNSSFINGTETLLRADSNTFNGKPKLLVLQSSLIHNPDSSREIRVKSILTFERSSNSLFTNYKQPFMKSETFQQEIQKKYEQVIISLDYTHRKSINKALNYWLMIGNLNFNQEANAWADNLFSMYGYTDSTLIGQFMYPKLQARMLYGGATTIIKKGSKIYEYKIEAFTTKYHYSNTAFFTGTTPTADTIPFSVLQPSYQHRYSFVKLETGRQYSIGKTKLKVNGKVGIEHLNRVNQQESDYQLFKPAIKLNFSSNTHFTRLISSLLSIDYNQSFETQHKMVQGIVPTGISQYNSYSNYEALQQKNLMMNAGFSINTKTGFSHYISVTPIVNFNGSAFINQVSGILNFKTDSFNTTNLKGYYFNYNGNYNVFMRKLHVHLNISNGKMQQQFLIQKDIGIGSSHFSVASLAINKQWKNKLFGLLSGTYSMWQNQLPDSFGYRKNPITHNLLFKSKLSYNLNESWNFSAHASWYNNNIGTQNQFVFTMADAEAQWKPKDKKFYFAGNIRNLLNIKSYQFLDISQFSQSFQSLPIIERNFVISYHRIL